MYSEGYSTWFVCLSESVCESVTGHPITQVIFAPQTNSPIQWWMKVKILSDFLWKCFVAELERFLLQYGYTRSAIFYSAENAHA